MNLVELVNAAVVRYAANGPGVTLTRENDLLEEGVLDSIGVLGVVAELEEVTGCRFDPADVVPEHFRTVGTIVQLVERRRAT
jgi:acyl carrier protein